MPWTTIAQLIIQVGYPVAQAIWQKAESGAQATQADWDALNAMTKQTAVDRMKAQLVAAGIDLASPQAIAMLALAA